MPEIKPCTKVFITTKSATFLSFSLEKANKIGRFAKPSRKKGKGFGMAYSTMDKKRHNAEKNKSRNRPSSRLGLEKRDSITLVYLAKSILYRASLLPLL